MVTSSAAGIAAALDERQRTVVELPAVASAVVIGAPGTGKTTALVARAQRLLRSGVAPDELLVVTPTRQTATALRDRLAGGLDLATPGPLARSVASFAFQLVRAAAVAAGRPLPQLLTAGDQDRIMAELLAGDEEDAASGGDRWPEGLGPGVRRSRGFRAELRALQALCADLGLHPEDLGRLGAVRDREVWKAAGSFLAEYRESIAWQRPAHRDPAELVHEAAELFARAGSEVIGPAARLRVVLVDDAQELTRGGIALLRAARDRGVAVVAFGDPDIGSGSFRGAGPELFDRLATDLGHVEVLDVPHRAAPALTRLTRAVTAAIGAAGRVEHRRPPGPPGDDEADAVTAIHAASPFEETDLIARTLRSWHVRDAIPWDRLAVIAHDSRQVARLETELAAREVPTRAVSIPRPIGAEPAVRALLGLVQQGLLDPGQRDPDAVAEALLSPFGGLDAVGLRRLRARLRIAELADGGTRPARMLLAEALAEPARLALVDTPEARRAERLASTLRRINDQAARGGTIHELLWIAWERSGLESRWVREAAGQGSTAEEATRSLDALVALFGAAKRSVERQAAGSAEAPARFIRAMLDTEVPEDLLTAPERAGAVSLLTPAAALGTQFEAVVIAGVQDGIWPNTRLRGGLLDAWRLEDDLEAWRTAASPPEPAVLDRRRGVLHEELRLFARAVSRARSRLVVTAVDDDDLGPSALFDFLPDPSQDQGPGHPLTLRGLVAQHRRTLTSSDDDAQRREAAGQLALLADAGVPGALPAQWYGIAPPSSDAPLHDLARAPVRVSPSRLEGFEKCGLDWAIRTLGGDSRSFSSGLGTILHAAMEDVPGGELEQLRRVVDERWGELEFEAPWLDRQEHAWAHRLVGRLHAYLTRVRREGGLAVGAETRFRLAIELPDDPASAPRMWPIPVAGAERDDDRPPGPHAVLSGSIDRVEVYPGGGGEQVPVDGPGPRVVVVDLKTGRSESRVSADKVRDDAQLSSYQLAVAGGLVDGVGEAVGAGARLVVLSKTLKDSPYRIAHQPALTPEQTVAFLQRVASDARGMAAASFIANIDTHCADDRFAVCRLHTVKPVSAS